MEARALSWQPEHLSETRMARSRLGRMLTSPFSPLPQRCVWERFAVALLAATLAILLRWFLEPALGHVAFYVTVYMAVAFCAVVCGYAPAVLSAVVGFLGVFYWFVDPRYTLRVTRPETHGIVGSVLVCAVLIALGETNRRKQLQLNEAITSLKAEAIQRSRAELDLQNAHAELEQRVRERTAQLSRALAELAAEAAVRKRAEEQLRRLSVRVMTLQDEERRRIARDLHDTSGQTLAAIKMTSALIEKAGPHTADLLQLIADLNALTDEALQEIRTTSYLLHPPLLDEAGIAAATRWFVEGFAKRSGIQVDCEVPECVERFDRNCELVVFRVLQESLTNVHRYSGASAAKIRLWLASGVLRFEVTDNGRGIPDQQLRRVQSGGESAGVGIAGMRERVRELGGQFEVRSDENGTTVSIAVPASRKTAPREKRIAVPAA